VEQRIKRRHNANKAPTPSKSKSSITAFPTPKTLQEHFHAKTQPKSTESKVAPGKRALPRVSKQIASVILDIPILYGPLDTQKERQAAFNGHSPHQAHNAEATAFQDWLEASLRLPTLLTFGTSCILVMHCHKPIYPLRTWHLYLIHQHM
jgi:hypothetical protein